MNGYLSCLSEWYIRDTTVLLRACVREAALAKTANDAGYDVINDFCTLRFTLLCD
jgi:hypothetical protein